MEGDIRRVFDAIESQCEVVFLIDHKQKNYRMLQGSEFWRALIPKEGTTWDLYVNLFIQNRDEKRSKQTEEYNVFVDESFFEKEQMQGVIHIPGEEGKRTFRYLLVRLSEREAGLTLIPFDEAVAIHMSEKEKIDAIQDNYLFSMIVDLRRDLVLNSNTTEINADAQSFMELKYSDWRNMISNMFLPEDRSMFLTISAPDYVMRMLEQNKSFKVDMQMMDMAGQFLWSRLSFQRMKGFSREDPRFVYTVRDIDQEMRQLLNQENIIKAVEEQNQQLQRTDQAKSAFISNMSHEIRTPINAVLGMNEMILRESEDEKICGYARDIQSASKLLLSIINDILDFSKIEAGKMEIVPAEYQLTDLIRNACNLIASKLRDKKLEFELHVDDEIPRMLVGDEVRVTQVITNILTNAVKYTEKGKVTFSVSLEEKRDRQVGIRYTVEDTGIGIRKEDMDRLYFAFTRFDAKRNRNIEGTGLGMSIVTRLLEQMGSELEVESEYGVGSRFTFVLTQEMADETPIGAFCLEDSYGASRDYEQPKEELLISRARILAVDDTVTNLKVIKALLKRTKAQVYMAQSGSEALELLKNRDVDLVLLDHLMPEMDGVETLSKIRKLGSPLERIPVIALTANVVSGAKDFYRGMGFDDYLEKPIFVEHLEEMLRQYLPEKCFD